MIKPRRCETRAWTRAAVALGTLPFQAFAQQPFHHPSILPGHNLTTAEFFRDLGKTFQALPTVPNIAPVVAGGAAYGLGTIWDQSLERHFAPGDVWGKWAAPGKYIGHPLILGGVSGTLFAISRGSDDVRFRSFSYALLQSSIVSSAIVQPTKAMFQRLRPSGENKHSFPSGHATDAFLYATVAMEHYGWKAGIPAYAASTYVAMSRLADRKHHITDVIAGAALGYLIGRTASGRMKLPSKITANLRASGNGFGAQIQIGLP